MSSAAITAEGLGKRYRIGAVRERPDTLRDGLALTLGDAKRRLGSLRERGTRNGVGSDATFIWALRDVSFQVEPGEVLGIIGRNGAGKSTLLKILSRITEPTEGQALVRGRVGSLLEVGTGFHPELTGRENIQLNGALIGMKRAEIRSKFDEIVSFAEVEQFIDTPVKRYSSGMYLRLAFGVAAFLEPDILIVDEVLAVGDARFQRKCLGKMDSVAKGGRTVLLVSHNMSAINRLCHSCMWLDAGRVQDAGETSSVVSRYLSEGDAEAADADAGFPLDEEKDSQLRSARLLNEEGVHCREFSCDEPVFVELVYEVRRSLSELYGCFEVWGLDGTQILVSYSNDHEPNLLQDLQAGSHAFRITIPPRSLGAGSYRLHFSVARSRLGGATLVDAQTIGTFSLEDLTTVRGSRRVGYFSTLLDWKLADQREPGPSMRSETSARREGLSSST